jgi:ferric-dicitrate binding protein FerR (iron transport regulator)
MAGDSKSRQNQINDEAAQWVVVLSEAVFAKQARQEFEAWRAQGPEYFLAYERALRAWNRAECLSIFRPAATTADPDLLVRYAPQRGLRVAKP